MRYVDSFQSRGRWFYYFRRHGQRIRLKGEPGTPEFAESYQRAKAGPKEDGGPGSLKALVTAFKASPEFQQLSGSSQKDYKNILEKFSEKYGNHQASDFKRRHIFKYRDDHAKTPAMANYIVAVIRRLFSWAVDMGRLEANPALRPKRLKTGPGHLVWSAAAIEKFRAAAEPELQWALDIALATGQRQGDILRMSWAAYDGQAVEVVQSKTGTKVLIPAHAALRATLERVAKRGTVILTTKEGKAWKADHFRHEWRAATLKAGLDGLTFHGLRHTAASWLAEAGCTDAEIAAITGHRTRQMVARYTEGASQRRRADSAMTKMGNAAATKVPSNSA